MTWDHTDTTTYACGEDGCPAHGAAATGYGDLDPYEYTPDDGFAERGTGRHRRPDGEPPPPQPCTCGRCTGAAYCLPPAAPRHARPRPAPVLEWLPTAQDALVNQWGPGRDDAPERDGGGVVLAFRRRTRRR